MCAHEPSIVSQVMPSMIATEMPSVPKEKATASGQLAPSPSIQAGVVVHSSHACIMRLVTQMESASNRASTCEYPQQAVMPAACRSRR